MFRVGLNPYGLTYTSGLQGAGTPRANAEPIGVQGFVALARDIGARCIELDWRWLTPMTDDDLARLRDAVAGMTPICSYWLHQQHGETHDAAQCATTARASPPGLISSTIASRSTTARSPSPDEA